MPCVRCYTIEYNEKKHKIKYRKQNVDLSSNHRRHRSQSDRLSVHVISSLVDPEAESVGHTPPLSSSSSSILPSPPFSSLPPLVYHSSTPFSTFPFLSVFSPPLLLSLRPTFQSFIVPPSPARVCKSALSFHPY